MRDAATGDAAAMQPEHTPAPMVDISKAVKTHAPDVNVPERVQGEYETQAAE